MPPYASLPDPAGRPLAIAHRHGNLVELCAAAAAARVDVLETDVFAWRRRVEVRHGRVVGPFLLDGRTLRRRPRAGLTLEQVVATISAEVVLMLDLKGWRPWTGRRVRAVMERAAPGRPYLVCGRRWGMLEAFRGDAHVGVVLSAATRRELDRLRTRLRTDAAWGVSVRRDLLGEPAVREQVAQGRMVMTWPVDTAAQREEVLGRGVRGVISDDLGVLAAIGLP